MPSHYDELPDLAFGHHPLHGIVAANPKNLVASRWMLARFDFHPVADQPTLYALADHNRDGQARTTRAVELLRASGYRVDVDAAFDPSLTPDAPPVRNSVRVGEPHVAFAEHPRLGIVAAVDHGASGLTGLALVEHGWRHHPRLDIYTLPFASSRQEALGRVADATLSLRRSAVRVAVHPHLAQDVAARLRPSAATTTSRERGHGAARKSAGKALAPTPAASAAAARPVDPRIAFSRPR